VSYRRIENTGELEVELRAASRRGVFEAAFEPMRELMSAYEAAQRLEVPVEVAGRVVLYV
jgi:hypothetical protein